MGFLRNLAKAYLDHFEAYLNSEKAREGQHIVFDESRAYYRRRPQRKLARWRQEQLKQEIKLRIWAARQPKGISFWKDG